MNEKFERLWATKNKNDEWWSSFVTSPLAIVANFFVVDWKWLTPNLVTLLSFLVAIVATGLMVLGGQTAFYLAALLIHLSHVLDCMDGQMARYRKVSSRTGSYYDKVTDLVQVFLWFGAAGYAANVQSQSILPIYLAFIGVAFYFLRGYIKYVTIYIEMGANKEYLRNSHQEVAEIEQERIAHAGLGHGLTANLRWLLGEQRKIFSFDEGVFIFMLSAALIFNQLIPMLWIFAGSQLFYGIARTLQRGRRLQRGQHRQILTTTEK
ncbi:MAG: phosphatidylglycerophosphate synthase [Candidatus Omnitrophota bacterium]|jgi:phosphatidylglycerophosphate synthase